MYPVWRNLRPSPPSGKIADPSENPVAKYFRGRAKHLDTFQIWMDRAKKKNGGTSFLVQGPPGAGKTALLYEYRKLAHAGGWITAIISTNALWDAGMLRHDMGKTAGVELTEVFGELGLEVAGIRGSLKGGGKLREKDISTKQILASAKAPLLLILDEAQTLGVPGVHPEAQREVSVPLLTGIHQGTMGIPVILAAGGLGMTANILDDLGISRHKDNCLIELHALKKENERAVLTDYLVKEGKAKGDVTPWVEQITQETHGWPQHINAYKNAAVTHLAKTEGNMFPEEIELVLQEGRELKRQYYKARTDKIDDNTFNGLAELFQNASLERGFKKEQIITAVGEKGFEQALAKGVLYQAENRSYSIPIPSLRDYMVREWTREREEAAQEKRRIRGQGSEQRD